MEFTTHSRELLYRCLCVSHWHLLIPATVSWTHCDVCSPWPQLWMQAVHPGQYQSSCIFFSCGLSVLISCWAIWLWMLWCTLLSQVLLQALRLRRSLFDYSDYRILQDLGRGKKLEWVEMSLEMEEPSLAMLSLPEQDISGYINWVISSCWFLIYDAHDDLWWSHNEYDFSWFIHDYDDSSWLIWILSHGRRLQVAPWVAAALAQFQPRRRGIQPMPGTATVAIV